MKYCTNFVLHALNLKNSSLNIFIFNIPFIKFYCKRFQI